MGFKPGDRVRHHWDHEGDVAEVLSVDIGLVIVKWPNGQESTIYEEHLSLVKSLKCSGCDVERDLVFDDDDEQWYCPVCDGWYDRDEVVE